MQHAIPTLRTTLYQTRSEASNIQEVHGALDNITVLGTTLPAIFATYLLNTSRSVMETTRYSQFSCGSIDSTRRNPVERLRPRSAISNDLEAVCGIVAGTWAAG